MEQNHGILTDLMFNKVTGDVTNREGYIVISSPATPDYYFCNALVLPCMPGDADKEKLESDFVRLVAVSPGIKHKCFTWSSHDENASLVSFIADGYKWSSQAVLSTDPRTIVNTTHLSQLSDGYELREFSSEKDWDQWLQINIENDEKDYPTQEFLSYLHAIRSSYKVLISQGLGHFWGAFLGGQQVAHAGLFFMARVGRFQSINTAKGHRNRSLCTSLVRCAALSSSGRADNLVIVADVGGHPRALYRKLGFVHSVFIHSLCKWRP